MADDLTIDDVLDIAIHDIEQNKARVRIEYDNLKEDYHRGAWRQHGLSKRQTEDRLFKRDGEVMGFERALSTLYTMKAARDFENGRES